MAKGGLKIDRSFNLNKLKGANLKAVVEGPATPKPKGPTAAERKAKRLENTRKAMAALHMVSQHMQGKNPTNPFDEQNTEDSAGQKVKTPKSETPKPPGYEEGKE